MCSSLNTRPPLLCSHACTDSLSFASANSDCSVAPYLQVAVLSKQDPRSAIASSKGRSCAYVAA